MTNGYNHVGGNLYISRDEVAILDFLIDRNLMPKSFKSAFVVSDMDNLNFSIIIFSPHETENKFMQFIFEDFAKDTETMIYLLNMFNYFAEDNYNIYKTAQKKLEDIYYMIPTFRAMLGYKLDDETSLYHS